MDFRKKRWICFAAGLVIISCNGFQYGLSVFQIPLSELYGWSIPQTAAAFSAMSIIEFAAVITIATWLRRLLGLRKYIMTGSILFSLGILACAFMQSSVFELYLYQGAFIGIGNAMIYPALTAYIIQIFPERSGFANGMMVAFFACGPVLWTPLSAYVLERTGDVSLSFGIIGTSMLALLIIMSLMVFEPPEDYLTESENEARSKSKPVKIKKSLYDVNMKGMLRKPEFYLFYFIFCVGILIGTMILTQGATISELGYGFSVGAAAAILAGLNIGNAAGRVVFGSLSDKTGIGVIVQYMFVIYIIVFAALLITDNRSIAIAAMIVSMLAFGSFCALLAPTTKALFGTENIQENFNIVYTGYALGGIGAPFLVANVREAAGSYTPVFIIEVVLSVLGLAFTIVLRKRAPKL